MVVAVPLIAAIVIIASTCEGNSSNGTHRCRCACTPVVPAPVRVSYTYDEA